MDTLSMAYTRLKTISALNSQNMSDISSRKYYEKDGANMPVDDERYDDIASHQKSMSHIGQE